MDLNFIKQKNILRLTDEVVGMIESKKSVNFNSPDEEQRKRASLLFRRLRESMYDLANEDDFSYLTKRPDGKYSYIVPDEFAIFIIELFRTNENTIVIIEEILWPYKNDSKNWWYIVEKQILKKDKLEHECHQIMEAYDRALHNLFY